MVLTSNSRFSISGLSIDMSILFCCLFCFVFLLIPFSLTTENGQDMERLLLDYGLICYVKVFLRLRAVLFHRSLKVHQTVNRAELFLKKKFPFCQRKEFWKEE